MIVILLLVSAVFWLFVARAAMRRISALDDRPTITDQTDGQDR